MDDNPRENKLDWGDFNSTPGDDSSTPAATGTDGNAAQPDPPSMDLVEMVTTTAPNDDGAVPNEKQSEDSEDDGWGNFTKSLPSTSATEDTVGSSGETLASEPASAPELGAPAVLPKFSTSPYPQERSSAEQSPIVSDSETRNADRTIETENETDVNENTAPDPFAEIPAATVAKPSSQGEGVGADSATLAPEPMSGDAAKDTHLAEKNVWASSAHGIWHRSLAERHAPAVEKVDGDWGDLNCQQQDGQLEAPSADEIVSADERQPASLGDAGGEEEDVAGGDSSAAGVADDPEERSEAGEGMLEHRDVFSTGGEESGNVLRAEGNFGPNAEQTEINWGHFGDFSSLPSEPANPVGEESMMKEAGFADGHATNVSEDTDWSEFGGSSNSSPNPEISEGASKDPSENEAGKSGKAEGSTEPLFELDLACGVEESKGKGLPVEPVSLFESAELVQESSEKLVVPEVEGVVPEELEGVVVSEVAELKQAVETDESLPSNSNRVLQGPVLTKHMVLVPAEVDEAIQVAAEAPLATGSEESAQAGKEEPVAMQIDEAGAEMDDEAGHASLHENGGSDTNDWGEFEQPSSVPRAQASTGVENAEVEETTNVSTVPAVDESSDNGAGFEVSNGTVGDLWGTFTRMNAPSDEGGSDKVVTVPEPAESDNAAAASSDTTAEILTATTSETPTEPGAETRPAPNVVEDGGVRLESEDDKAAEPRQGEVNAETKPAPSAVEDGGGNLESEDAKAAESGQRGAGSGGSNAEEEEEKADIGGGEEEWSDFGDFEEAPTPDEEATKVPQSDLSSKEIPAEAEENPVQNNTPNTPAKKEQIQVPKEDPVESKGSESDWNAIEEPGNAPSAVEENDFREVTSSPPQQHAVADRVLAVSVAVFERAFATSALDSSAGKDTNDGGADEKAGAALESLVDVTMILRYSAPCRRRRGPVRLGKWATSCILRGIRPVSDALPLEDSSDDNEDLNGQNSSVRPTADRRHSMATSAAAVSVPPPHKISEGVTVSTVSSLATRVVEPSVAPPPPPRSRRLPSPSVAPTSPPSAHVTTTSVQFSPPSVQSSPPSVGSSPGVAVTQAASEGGGVVLPLVHGAGPEYSVEGSFSKVASVLNPPIPLSPPPPIPAKIVPVAVGLAEQECVQPGLPFEPDISSASPADHEGDEKKIGRQLTEESFPSPNSAFSPFETSFAAIPVATSEGPDTPEFDTQPSQPPSLSWPRSSSTDGSAPPMPQHAPPRVPSPPPRAAERRKTHKDDDAGASWVSAPTDAGGDDNTNLDDDSDFGAWEDGGAAKALEGPASNDVAGGVVEGSPAAGADAGNDGDDDDDWDDDPFDTFQSAPDAEAQASKAPVNPSAVNQAATFAAFETTRSPSPEKEPPSWNLDFFMGGTPDQQPVRKNSDSVAAGIGVLGVRGGGAGDGAVTSGKRLDLISQALAGYGIADSPAGEYDKTSSMSGPDHGDSLASGPKGAIGGTEGGDFLVGGKGGFGGGSLSDLLRATRICGGSTSPRPIPLSAAAQAKVDALPDLSFMLSSRLKFPMVAALVSPATGV